MLKTIYVHLLNYFNDTLVHYINIGISRKRHYIPEKEHRYYVNRGKIDKMLSVSDYINTVLTE